MKYQAYEEYKDSGVEWVGKYPAGWGLTRVKFESYVKARVGWHGLKSDDFTDEGAYLVTGSDFKGPVIKWEDCYHCDFDRYEQDPYIQLKEGDLLITKDGTIGKVALVSDLNGKATLNSGVFVVRPLADNYTSKFYFWLLQASVFTGFVDFNKTGSTIVHLYQDTFVNFRYALPSLNEQQIIANFLDHETAKIDTLIEKQQQLIKLLKEKRQAVISHAVTKGLNPTNSSGTNLNSGFIAGPQGEGMDSPSSAPMRDSGVEWLGEVPEHWDVCKLKHIISSLESGVSVNAADIPAQGDELGVLKTSCVYTRSFRFEENKTVVKDEYDRVKCPVRKGAIIISRMNTPELVGASALVETEHPNVFLPDRLWQTVFSDDTQLNPVFISFFMMIEGFRNQISLAAEGASSSMQNIAKDDYLSINIAFPDINEQNTIAKYLENRLSNLKTLEGRANEAIDLIQERRKALISAAVTGKIDVRHHALHPAGSANTIMDKNNVL